MNATIIIFNIIIFNSSPQFPSTPVTVTSTLNDSCPSPPAMPLSSNDANTLIIDRDANIDTVKRNAITRVIFLKIQEYQIPEIVMNIQKANK